MKARFTFGLIILFLSTLGSGQYINTSLENVSGTFQCNLTSLQEVYNGADWYEYDLDLIELYANSSMLLRNSTYEITNTTFNLTLSRLETAFSCQSYVICRGILWNATAYYLEDGEITEIFESINTSTYLNCTTTSTSSTTSTSTTVTSTTTVTTLDFGYYLPDEDYGTLPGLNGSGGTLPGSGVSNTTGLGESIIGFKTSKLLQWFAIFLALGFLGIRPFALGVSLSAFSVLFFTLIIPWNIYTTSVCLIICFVAMLEVLKVAYQKEDS